MIQVAACDDDLAVRRGLKKCLNKFGVKYGIEVQVIVFASGEELIESEERFDIIFLGIGLAGIDGIQTGTEIRKKDKKVKIIYLTAFLGYMEKAFQVHAFGYMEKPFKEEKIHQILLEAITYGKLNVADSMTFHTKMGLLTMQIQKIAYFEYWNRSVLLHDCSNQVYELPGEKISKIAERMKPYYFEVPHKSFVVNLSQVKSIKGYDLYMNHGKVLPLSQFYSKNFRKVMHEYWNTRT